MSTTAKKKTKPKTQRKSSAKPRAPKRAPSPKKAETVPTAPPPPIIATPAKESAPMKSFLLAIRLKGSFGTPWPIQKSLETLRLKGKFNAVLVENNPAMVGMLRAVKDYVTWAEASKENITALISERGEFSNGAQVTDELTKERFGEPSVQELASALIQGRISLQALWHKGLKPVFRLRPPSGGFAGSSKRAHGSHGELGKRQVALTSLLTRMA